MTDTVINGLDIRTSVPEGKDVIRTRIMERILDILETAPFDEDYPVEAGGAPLFDIAKRGNLEDIARRETPGCAIEEGTEQLSELMYEKSDKKLRVFFNFKVIKAEGIDPEPLINYYFARIVKLFVTTRSHFSDEDGNELARDIAEAGNSIQTNGSTDPEPGGVIYLDIDYRHARGDWATE